MKFYTVRLRTSTFVLVEFCLILPDMRPSKLSGLRIDKDPSNQVYKIPTKRSKVEYNV